MSDFNLQGEIKLPLRRIISLAPSITEMLFYLGLGESVIGVTRQCDYPAEVTRIESLGSLVLPDTKRILELSPDVIIGLSDLHAHIFKVYREKGIGLILLNYHNIQGILDIMEAISSLAIDTKTSLQCVASLRERTDRLLLHNKARVRTLFLLRESPLMLPSRFSYLYDALKIAGASQITTSYTQYERVTFEEVLHFDPEVIFACGYKRGERSRKICPDCQSTQPLCQRVVDDIGLKPGWKETWASTSGNIFALPCHWLCRPGPRLIDGIESIAKILQRCKHK